MITLMRSKEGFKRRTQLSYHSQSYQDKSDEKLLKSDSTAVLLLAASSDLLLGLTNSSTNNNRIGCVDDLLDQLGLNGLATRPIHTLSGGQKQRLAIAGALASDAGLLLLDEPTALLDPESQRTVLDAVHMLCQKRDQPLTALWITHRLEELDRADGAALMKDGRIEPWQDGPSLRKRLQSGRSGR